MRPSRRNGSVANEECFFKAQGTRVTRESFHVRVMCNDRVSNTVSLVSYPFVNFNLRRNNMYFNMRRLRELPPRRKRYSSVLEERTGAESTGRYPNVIDTESLEDGWPRDTGCPVRIIVVARCAWRVSLAVLSPAGCHRRRPSSAPSRNLIAV